MKVLPTLFYVMYGLLIRFWYLCPTFFPSLKLPRGESFRKRLKGMTGAEDKPMPVQFAVAAVTAPVNIQWALSFMHCLLM